MRNAYIDLHCHLDGSITPSIAKELAALQDIPLPEEESELERLLSLPQDCENLNDFLKCFALPLTLLQTKIGIREAVRKVAKNCFDQGVCYLEIRFAPQLHMQKGLSQEEAIIAAQEGLLDNCNLILCCMRGEGNEEANEETVRLAAKYLKEDGGVVALDLAGAEGVFSTRNYRTLFAKARELGIPFTIHAGEADGAESVLEAALMGARRIGHGVRITEDEKVKELVKDRGIFLECCPTSNRQTKAVEDMRTYPLRAFLSEGIRATVNTDDMAICMTTMEKELLFLKDKYGLTEEEESILTANAIDAAFTSPQKKEMLRRKLLR